MLDKLQSLFKSKSSSEPQEPETPALHIAVAAVLVDAARIDERYDEKERMIIDRALSATFSLSTDDAQALRAKGEAAQASSLDIHRFTRVIKTMTVEERIAFAERLWEIILSDGERDPHEDALMRRLCGLIYIDDKDSGAARARAAERLRDN
ncbi:MAG: TerB family tellurite resistance protein [Pseudomonadota bacterium]